MATCPPVRELDGGEMENSHSSLAVAIAFFLAFVGLAVTMDLRSEVPQIKTLARSIYDINQG
jgi:hypothetical protein